MKMQSFIHNISFHANKMATATTVEEIKALNKVTRELIKGELPLLDAEVKLVDGDYLISADGVEYTLYISEDIISFKNNTLKTEICISTNI